MNEEDDQDSCSSDRSTVVEGDLKSFVSNVYRKPILNSAVTDSYLTDLS